MVVALAFFASSAMFWLRVDWVGWARGGFGISEWV